MISEQKFILKSPTFLHLEFGEVRRYLIEQVPLNPIIKSNAYGSEVVHDYLCYYMQFE